MPRSFQNGAFQRNNVGFIIHTKDLGHKRVLEWLCRDAQRTLAAISLPRLTSFSARSDNKVKSSGHHRPAPPKYRRSQAVLEQPSSGWMLFLQAHRLHD